jgi:hypothetical protein
MLNDSLNDSGHFLPVVVELAQQDSVLRAGLDEASSMICLQRSISSNLFFIASACT